MPENEKLIKRTQQINKKAYDLFDLNILPDVHLVAVAAYVRLDDLRYPGRRR